MKNKKTKLILSIALPVIVVAIEELFDQINEKAQEEEMEDIKNRIALLEDKSKVSE